MFHLVPWGWRIVLRPGETTTPGGTPIQRHNHPDALNHESNKRAGGCASEIWGGGIRDPI
jgi:hypothetical protein